MRLPPTPLPPRLSRSGLVLCLYGGLSALAILWGALRGRPNVFFFTGVMSVDPARTAKGVAAAVAFALLLVFLNRWASHRLEWARVLDEEFRNLLGALSPSEVLLLAGASSVGEELFFRGAALPHLGLWLSSALFALPHIGPGKKFLPWTFTSFIVGLSFGGLFLYSGDLAAPITAHFLINLINLQHITRR